MVNVLLPCNKDNGFSFGSWSNTILLLCSFYGIGMCRQLPTYYVTICNHLIVSIVINYFKIMFVYMKYYTLLCGTQLKFNTLI